MKRLFVLVLSLLALVAGIVMAWSWRVSSRTEPSEFAAYFKHPTSKTAELIKLTIVSRVPPSVVKSRVQAHREELQGLVLKAVALRPSEPDVVREVRREILDILRLEGRTYSIEFSVVPDLSTRRRNEDIRRTLERSPG